MADFHNSLINAKNFKSFIITALDKTRSKQVDHSILE